MNHLTRLWLLACGMLPVLLPAQAPLSYKLQSSSWEYTVVTPPGKAKGLIVYIPGFTQTAQKAAEELTLPAMAYKYGISTIIVPCGAKLYADGEVLRILNEAITRVMTDHEIPKDKVAIGGTAAGGTIALSYSEFCTKFPYDYPAQPKAVFAVESPVDLSHLYESLSRQILRNFSASSVAEAQYMRNTMERELSGDPSKNPQRYQDLSPCSISAADGGNIRLLKNVAVRSYNDEDVRWSIQNRGRSFLDMPVTDASEMMNQLRMAGSKLYELKTIDTKKTNAIGAVDQQELLVWILNQLSIPVNGDAQSLK